MSRERDSANYVFLFFAVLSVLLLLFPSSRWAHTARIIASYSLYPSMHYGADYSHFVRNVPSNVVDLLETDQQNRELKAHNRDLKLKLQSAALLEAENARLADQMKLVRYKPWEGTWARVVNKTPSDWYGSLFISKGSADGVKVNDTVIGFHEGGAALAGRILEVYPEFSKVLLLTNGAASAVCTIVPDGVEALVEGRGSWLLRMNYVPDEAKLAEGDSLVTARGGLLYPPGVPVGRVVKVHQRESAMNFITADVAPLVHANNLREVFVVSRSLPGKLRAAEGGQ